MKNISLSTKKTSNFIEPSLHEELVERAILCQEKLIQESTDTQNKYLGWLQLPTKTTDEFIFSIQQIASQFKQKLDAIVVIGIGGSYLGAKAVIDALSHSFSYLQEHDNIPQILYAGHQVNEDYLVELLEVLENKNFGICVISKSGTTTEPAIAFRILKKFLEEQIGDEKSSERIVAITDEHKGALRMLANEKQYQTFIIPDNVGGRYSVLTPVGLFPIACAGIDITQLLDGARDMQKQLLLSSYEDNIALQYAVMRNALYEDGKKIEALVNYHPKLTNIGEWWKQLFGESEGKEHKGVFPTTLNFTTDLHSMGQYIQEGERTIFETVISIDKTSKRLEIPQTEENLDSLNYLSGRRLGEVNKSAELATTIAHMDGGVPCLRIIMPELSAYYIGQLIYFFEFSCAVSGELLNVNPFDQPGVEAYKKNMFALLGKEGYEKETEILNQRIDSESK